MATAGSRYTWLGSQIWQQPWFQDLSPEAKLLFFYASTCPENTCAGVYQWDPRVAHLKTGPWKPNAWEAAVSALDPHVQTFPKGWIFVKGYLEHNSNHFAAKVLVGARAVVREAPPDVQAAFGLVYREAYAAQGIAYPEATDSLSEAYGEATDNTVPVPVPVTKKGQEKHAPKRPARSAAPGTCSWCTSPLGVNDEGHPRTKRLAQVYHDAYRDAHGECPEPLDKAKDWPALGRLAANGKPWERTVAVLQHGVRSENAFVVSIGHRVWVLVSNFQGIAGALDRGVAHGAAPGQTPSKRQRIPKASEFTETGEIKL